MNGLARVGSCRCLARCRPVMAHCHVSITMHHVSVRILNGEIFYFLKVLTEVWAVALVQVGHMTLFETVASGDLIMTKSYVAFPLLPGQNAWHFAGYIPPALSNASMKMRSQENVFPTEQIVGPRDKIYTAVH